MYQNSNVNTQQLRLVNDLEEPLYPQMMALLGEIPPYLTAGDPKQRMTHLQGHH
jgi:hypothetical protein